MGEFLEQEKSQQVAWKSRTSQLTEDAKRNGKHSSGRPYPFCLGLAHSVENLVPQIREQAVQYFKEHGIKWHDGVNEGPSTHLADSQVCCLNFLMPLGNSEALLLKLFQRYFPDIAKVLPMNPGSLVAFEWIGAVNYLREKVRPGEERTRGSMCTSVDAAVMFMTGAGKKIIVLIEWKYSESYTDKSYRYSTNGTDRTTIYQHLWDKESGPVAQHKVGAFENLFFEPFYQFMRQQYLASEMELAHELGADEVYLMHLSSKANTDFPAITSKALEHLGTTATEVWKNVQRDGSRFLPLYTEDFFDKEIIITDPKLRDYWAYLAERYPSILMT